ncbi:MULTISPECIES: bifunctional UDP-sugar hydrolase/5'-nucleotidase UshA [unclassified Endozoicomonas]|uniref:bifunctional UDP-sugar hydrolase/5'-nucleotidase UshA n=1 Tax=unclassified Endozoicomonas TaxID=2644528 RepID=UPI003BB742A4
MLYPRWLLLSFPILLLLNGCATDTGQYREPALKTLNFTIIHTNDNHGKFWRNRDGEVGMAARKTLIDRIRADVEAEGGKSLVLSAGDINTGVPESDLQEAEPDFIGMNLIGYDAMTVGNHEFDNPLPVLLKQEKWADFPFLSANIFYKDTGKPVFKPWVMKELQGVRVAILGLTTEDTESQALKENIKDIRFDDAIETGTVWVPKLIRDEKADIVIALTHMGHYPNARHGHNAPGDVSLAKEVDGVDIIVGGHSQSKLHRPDIKNSTYVLQAWEWGKYVGRADFIYQYLDSGRGHSHGLLKMVNYRLIPVNLKKEKIIDGKKELITIEPEIPEDPAVLKALKPYQDKASELMNQVVGSINQTLDGSREKVRSGPAAIGNLIARAQMEKTKADLAVMNSGGVRTGLQAGKITEKDILKIQPFGNMVCYLEMTGRELRNYIEDIAAIQPVSGGLAHFANVRLTMAGDKLMSLDIGGKPVDKNRKYRMAINAFSAAGGDNWPVVDDNLTFVNTGYTDAVVLRDYVKRYSPLKRSEYLPKGEIVRK